jgi:type II restriction/modification system DNA methylase subunit YeeA
MNDSSHSMTPEQFIEKWSRVDGNERQTAQEHFIDLCRMLGEPTPNEGDKEVYSFEKGASKVDGSAGFADVWKSGHFGWEYKKDRANLDRAYQQLLLYSVALENPPLLVVSDTKRFRVYTNWTNTVQQVHEFTLDDLRSVDTRETLQWIFRNPEKLKPAKTREQVTREAADKFSTIALRLQGHPPEKVAHFLNRLVFCLFADDVNLLSDDLFTRLLDNLAKRRERVPEQSQKMLSELFGNMQKGGAFGLDHILHFNGGLFDNNEALPLDADSLDILREIAKQDWSAIDPTIFGTLFERFLDPDKRAQIGAHYTDREKIMMIVEPVIVRPLSAEWEAVKAELKDILSKNRNRDGAPGKASLSRAEERLDRFMKRLDAVRVLDPACGSGNFLYLALQSLKDIERRAIVEAVEMGMQLRVVRTGPRNVKGIEINQYAAELARTSIWIGNIQWERRNGFEARKEPVLEPLDAIECRDALIVEIDRKLSSLANLEIEYGEANWPDAEFIVGNPPFLGDKSMRDQLGAVYTSGLRRVFDDRVPGGADLVCYWFHKATNLLMANRAQRAGFVATNSIRGGANRVVVDEIVRVGQVFDAWSNEEWTVDGAAVRVSLICFQTKPVQEVRLDGKIVANINADLTAGEFDLTAVQPLYENSGTAFNGITKKGSFDLKGEVARNWVDQPLNPNGRSNADVLRPWLNGEDVTTRRSDKWIINFGEMTEREANLYETPFKHVADNVYAQRQKTGSQGEKRQWWLLGRRSPALFSKLANLNRFIVTPETPTHTVFVWLPTGVIPDKNLVAIAKDDDVTFGVLHSRFHIAWARRLGSPYGNHPTARRYNSTRVFRTFPFPSGLTPNIPAKDYEKDSRALAIAEAAKRLDELRNAWLNPPDLVDIVPEVVPGYPDRILPKNEKAAAELKKRTLTNLYNARPQWLDDAHHDLDAAVAAAYGWPADISEDDALAKLLELNLARAAAGDAASEDDDEDGEEKAAELFGDAPPKRKPRKK